MSRLRARCLRDAKVIGEPAPIRPHTGYGHPGIVHGGPPPGSDSRGFGSPGTYSHFKVLLLFFFRSMSSVGFKNH